MMRRRRWPQKYLFPWGDPVPRRVPIIRPLRRNAWSEDDRKALPVDSVDEDDDRQPFVMDVGGPMPMEETLPPGLADDPDPDIGIHPKIKRLLTDFWPQRYSIQITGFSTAVPYRQIAPMTVAVWWLNGATGWVWYDNSLADDGWLFSWNSVPGTPPLTLAVTNSQQTWVPANSSFMIPVNDGLWHLAMFLWDGVNITFVLDGVLDVPVVFPHVFFTASPYNLSGSPGGNFFWPRIWDRLLSAAECLTLAKRPLQALNAGLVHEYDMLEGAGLVLGDDRGGNTGFYGAGAGPWPTQLPG